MRSPLRRVPVTRQLGVPVRGLVKGKILNRALGAFIVTNIPDLKRIGN